MIPYEIDPSLHSAEPEPQVLEDGFSPPRHEEPAVAGAPAAQAPAAEAALPGKSPF